MVRLTHKQRYKLCIAKRKALKKQGIIKNEGFIKRREECLKKEVNRAATSTERKIASSVNKALRFKPFKEKDRF